MREVDPKTTDRAMGGQRYINAPMPRVTSFKTLDITPLYRLSRKGHKLNMLLCFCAGAAAQRAPQFRRPPVGRALVEYDAVAVNTIVADRAGGLTSCDSPLSASRRGRDEEGGA